jgi:hypothetical protein
MSFSIVLNMKPDAAVLTVTFLFCLFATLLFSLGPALKASNADLVSDLKQQAGEPVQRVENEMRSCEAHFWKTFDYATAPVTNAGTGTGELYWSAPNAGATNQWSPRFLFPTTMRTPPTYLGYNPAAANNQVRNLSTNTDHTAVGITGNSRRGFRVDSSVTPWIDWTGFDEVRSRFGGWFSYHVADHRALRNRLADTLR